jgi:HEAT repeat protein
MPLFGAPDTSKQLSRHDVPKLVEALEFRRDMAIRHPEDVGRFRSRAGRRSGRAAEIRDSAARALEECHDARAAEPLIEALRADPYPHVRNAATKALRGLRDPGAAETLIAALHDDNHDVSSAAEGALENLGNSVLFPLLAALHDEDSDVRTVAGRLLEKVTDARAVDPLIAALHDGDSDVRRRAAEFLGNLGDARAVDPLIAALHDEDTVVRRQAAESLGNLGDARAVDPLIAALHDEDSDGRWHAAKSLGNLRYPRALDPLIAMLVDEDEWVHKAAADAVLVFGARAVVPLISALHDHDGRVRAQAANLLGRHSFGRLTDAGAVEALMDAALVDDDPSVRRAAVRALPVFDHARITGALVTALHDENSEVWSTALAALDNVPGARRDPQLAGPLADALVAILEKFRSSDAMCSLGSLLEVHAAAVDTDTLRRATTLHDSDDPDYRWPMYMDDYTDDQRFAAYVSVSARVWRLSREELIRRGLQA